MSDLVEFMTENSLTGEFDEALEAVAGSMEAAGVTEKKIDAALEHIACNLMFLEMAAYKLGYEERDKTKGRHPASNFIHEVPHLELIEGGKK